MKKILIPTDFSKESQNAIQYTVDFFKDLQVPCHILLLNMYLISKMEKDQIIEANDQAKKHSQINLVKELSYTLKCAEDFNLKVDTLSILGSLANVIPDVVLHDKIDLIVMGKDGGHHIDDVSRALKAAHSNCPLLTVFHH